MWELDYKESWVLKNWCFWTVVLEKTLESSLDRKEIQPVHPKGDQSWIFIGGTDAEAETLILWPPDVKNWHIGKDPDAGKGWRREEKGMTEDEMVGWVSCCCCFGKVFYFCLIRICLHLHMYIWYYVFIHRFQMEEFCYIFLVITVCFIYVWGKITVTLNYS